MENVYVYQEKQVNNNASTYRAANNFVIFDTNFLIKICISKAYSNKLVSNMEDHHFPSWENAVPK